MRLDLDLSAPEFGKHSKEDYLQQDLIVHWIILRFRNFLVSEFAVNTEICQGYEKPTKLYRTAACMVTGQIQ